VLLEIRATLTLFPQDEVAARLQEGLRAVSTDGPSAEESARLDQQLLAEGSYYIVSLQYLVEAGGAAWPTDRSASSYDNDARAELAELQTELFATVAARRDPLPLLQRVQQINALTEGSPEGLEAGDFFAGRDAVVADALRRRTGRG
jgi:hypothetical protein